MGAQTRDVKILRYGTKDGHQSTAQPMAASASIYSGTIAVTNYQGYAKSAATVTSVDTCWGVYNGLVDGTPTTASPIANGTTAGTHWAGIDTGTFYLTSGINSDAITQANIGSTCYVIDEITVGLTSGTNTRPVAGKVVAIGQGQYSSFVAVLLGNNQSTGSP